MKDKQQSGLPQNPGSNPEGSKGTGSRDVPWTPGPWEFRAGNNRSGDSVDLLMAEIGQAQSDEDPEYAEVLFGNELSESERSANWTLIAAAPELYEALEDVERMFTAFPLLAGANSGKLSRIRTVLAKARGEL